MHRSIGYLLFALVLVWNMEARATVTVGDSTNVFTYPFQVNHLDSRTQSVYRAAEIGNAGEITAVELYVSTTPGTDLEQLNIRMKHTTDTQFTNGSFDNSGLQLVFSASNIDVGNWDVPGWVTFNLGTPFNYNGTDNLIVDMVVDNSTSTGYSGRVSSWNTGLASTRATIGDLPSGSLLNTSSGSLYTYAAKMRFRGTITRSVSGDWFAGDNPHRVEDDLLVEAGTSLTIHDDVEIFFHGDFGMEVFGNLIADCQAGHEAHFRPGGGYTQWRNIVFHNGTESLLDLAGVQFENARGGEKGGALYIEGLDNTHTNQITRARFVDCAADSGGAVMVSQAKCHFEEVSIQNCTAGTAGGGILLSGTNGLSVSNCLFETCQAPYGGAMFLIHNSNLKINEGSEIRFCSATISGGAQYGFHSSYKLIRVLIADCSSPGSIVELDDNSGSTCYFYNVTLTACSAGSGLITQRNNAHLDFLNGILWGNSDSNDFWICSYGNSHTFVFSSDYEGYPHDEHVHSDGTGFFNFGHLGFSISADPCFVAPAEHDYRLALESRCLDRSGYNISDETMVDPDGTPWDLGYASTPQVLNGTLVFQDGTYPNTLGPWGSPYRLFPQFYIFFDNLTIYPGTEIIFEDTPPGYVICTGNVDARGTEEDPIIVRGENAFAGVTGFTMNSVDTARIAWWEVDSAKANYIFNGNLSSESYFSFDHVTLAGMRSMLPGETFFWGDSATSLHFSGGNPQNLIFSRCRFGSGQSFPGIIDLDDCGATFDHCEFIRPYPGGSMVSAGGGSQAYFDFCTFEDYAPDSSRVFSIKNQSFVGLNSCILRTAPENALVFDEVSLPSQFTLDFTDYSGLENSASLPGGTVNFGYSCFSEDPLFVDEAGGDFHLQANSPCIDQGNPFGDDDPDFTPPDVGAHYYDQSNPVITLVVDYPEDQGHQVIVDWEADKTDLAAYHYGTFYSLWRLDVFDDRSDGADRVYNSPDLALRENPEAQPGDLHWEDRSEFWTYVGQVPAANLPQYALPAPTLHDSSAVTDGFTEFRVIYHGLEETGISPNGGGYSVDNIPPDEVCGLRITDSGRGFQLIWEEVTTGTFGGNHYEELNGIWYRVYGGDEPYFPCDTAHYLCTTTATTLSVDDSLEKHFYRVITSDSEE